MTRDFNRDFALVNNFFPDWNPNWMVAESNDKARLLQLREELSAEGWSSLEVIPGLQRGRVA